MRTRQEIYDIGVKQLVKQRKLSSFTRLRDFTECAYRGSGGAKCLIGALIDDKDYKLTMEGQNVRCKEIYDIAGIAPADVNFSYTFQAVHDVQVRIGGTYDVVLHNLRNFAEIHNLQVPEELNNAIKELE